MFVSVWDVWQLYDVGNIWAGVLLSLTRLITILILHPFLTSNDNFAIPQNLIAPQFGIWLIQSLP